jgi:hypothetical protein
MGQDGEGIKENLNPGSNGTTNVWIDIVLNRRSSTSPAIILSGRAI